MTDIRPIRIHPKTKEVMREIGMMEMVEDENVPFDPQMMGVVMPKDLQWVDFATAEEEQPQDAAQRFAGQLAKLHEFLAETPGTGQPLFNDPVGWAIECITELMRDIQATRVENVKLEKDRDYWKQRHYLEHSDNEEYRAQIRRVKKALKRK